MGLQEFITKNREFWKDNINQNCEKKLLIEEAEIPLIVHDLAIHSILLNKSKDYQPVWLPNDNVSLELLKSYIPCAEKAAVAKLNFFEKLKVFVASLLQFLKVLINRNVLSVKYDGVKYGDIVYDGYLADKKVASIKKIDLKIYGLIRKCIKRHFLVIKTLKQNNISAVLVSHRIGIIAGVMLRAALRQGCEIYSLAGMHRGTLVRTTELKDMIKYEYSPTKEDVEKITSLPDEQFNKLYEKIKDFHINGNCSMDAKFAFSDEKKFYTNREDFAKDHNLDPNKKNIFIMLHAFTDYPHSHFKWMIFKDYGDWFLKTLNFAKKDKNVNWIFKQHPADKFYPTNDINFQELFKRVPDNIVFLDVDNKLDTRSLVNVADAIITCLGSAGFEIPAMSDVAAITASDNHYQGLGFSINPKTKKEYFGVLKDLKNIKRLTVEQQKIAKAVYMFIYYFCTVDFNSMPYLSMEEHHKSNMNDWYWDKVLEVYNQNKETIISQMNKYSKDISKEDFKALRLEIRELEKKGVI